MIRKIGFICLVTLMVLHCGSRLQGQTGGPVQYIYDDLGRLIKVIDPSGNMATYSYDAVGNILNISRSSLGFNALAVLNVIPRSGTVGTTVAIQGQGFSTVPTANSVVFNGSPAPVTSANSIFLTAVVPPGATTGPLTVAVGGVTVPGGNFTVIPATVVTLNISAPSTSLQVGATEQLSATALLSNGNTIDATFLASWTSSNSTVVSVSNASGSQGQVTATGSGLCIITATFVNQSRTIPLSVGNLTGIRITPALSTIRIPKGGTQQLKALGTFSNGDSVDVTGLVTWSSSASAAAVDNTGLVTGNSPGETQVTASLNFNGLFASGSANVSVFSLTSIVVFPQDVSLPAGGSQNFTAHALFSDGVTQDVTDSVTWFSSDTQIAVTANTSPNIGLVTARAPGAVAVTATYNSNLALVGVSAPISGLAPVLVSSATLPPVSPRFAYIPNNNDGTISQYTVDAGTGQLRPSGYLFDHIARSDHNSAGTGIVTDSAGKFAFVTNSNSDSISAFTINPGSGGLTPVAGSPFAVVPGASSAQIPQAVAVDPMGRYLYCANRAGASISGFAINATTGALTLVPGSPVVGGSGGPPREAPVSLAVDPAGKFVFVAENGVNQVSVYSINQQTGSLTEITGSPFPAGNSPAQIVVHPSGNFVYVANSGEGTVSQFSVNLSTGALTAVGKVSVGPINLEAPLALSPSGQFAYVLNPASVLAFSIDSSSGALTPVAGSPFPTNLDLGEVIAIDPSGRFVYAEDEQSSEVAILGIDPNDGSLVYLSQLGTRVNPVAFAVTGSAAPLTRVAKFAYVANPGANNLIAYSIDPVTEALVVNPSSPFVDAFKPVSVTTDPSGKFLIATNQCSDAACQSSAGSISIYTIDSATGSLTSTSGSPFPAGSGPVQSAVDPAGRFLYVVNSLDNTISGYSITSATGVLTAIAGSPFPTDDSPLVLSIASTGKFAYLVSSCPTCGTGTEISLFAIDATTGALSLEARLPGGGASPSETTDPFSRFVFLGGVSGISVFAESPTSGLLSPVAPFGQAFPAGSSPASVVVDPSGRFLYIANNGDNTISGDSIDEFTGTLWPMIGSPFAVGSKPTSLAIDATGLTIYVTNSGDGTVSAFAIDPVQGTLAPLIGSPYAAGTTPLSIVTTAKTQ
jgi:YD repeat-containing protein